MYSDISLVCVAWNEELRAPELLSIGKEWFEHLVVGVQESTDGTLVTARDMADRPTDQVIEHPHYGYGDKSMPALIRATQTRWAFVLAFDELPSQDLLESLGDAVSEAEAKGIDAWWIPFRSFVQGVEYTEQHGHLRLFERKLKWPGSMHSRPSGNREREWPTGYITHTRSLDEMIQDYLRYYTLGRGNPGWDNHNRLMMHDACVEVAKVHGWDFVQSHAWWPEVESIAFR